MIAHPARYKFSANEEYALFTEFKAHGGRGVEVVTGSHTAAEAVRYADTAREYDLLASRGSDFHSPDESRIDLGGLPPLPAGPDSGVGRARVANPPAPAEFRAPADNRRMSQYFEVHPVNPQPRLLKQAAQILEDGGIAAIPTDSSYAFACHLDDKAAAEKLRRIRAVDERHHLTLLCRDLSELASYARVDNRQYRLLKLATPGPFTFILEATKEVPRRVSHPSRRTVGLRVPDHPVTSALLELMGQPLLATTLIAPGESEPMNDPALIRERFEKMVQAIVDGGACPMAPTTVIDLSGATPVVVRLGRGDPALLGLTLEEGA